MINSYTIPAMKLNWFAFLRAFYRRSSSQTKPTVECFFNSMDNEIWKNLLGIYKDYRVSNFWRVIWPKWRILKYCKHRGWYLMVNLQKSGARKMCTVHRLVAMNFIDNPNNLPVVNHKDWNKKNNIVENLEWCTQQENAVHAFKNKLIENDFIGKPFMKWKLWFLHPASKSIVQMDLDRNIIKIFWSSLEMVRNTNFDRTSVRRVCKWKQKQYQWFLWKYWE